MGSSGLEEFEVFENLEMKSPQVRNVNKRFGFQKHMPMFIFKRIQKLDEQMHENISTILVITGQFDNICDVLDFGIVKNVKTKC